MDISINIQVTNLKYYIHIKNIAVEGIVSQIVDIGPGLFSIKSKKKYSKKINKKLPIF